VKGFGKAFQSPMISCNGISKALNNGSGEATIRGYHRNRSLRRLRENTRSRTTA
jgi:hypothetical protein